MPGQEVTVKMDLRCSVDMHDSVVLVSVDGSWVERLVEVGGLAVYAVDGISVCLSFLWRHALEADPCLDGVTVTLP